MPRYRYHCIECNEEMDIFHLFDESITECPECNTAGSLSKLLTIFSTSKKTTVKNRTGDITEKFIKDAKSELKQQQKESMDKR